MIIQQDETTATYQINRYEPGKIWINQQAYDQSVIIRPHSLATITPRQLSELTVNDFSSLFEDLPQIFLLGTGSKLIIPPEELLRPLFEKGIGVEFMDSKTASYTFTVLAAEERNVAACILVS
ncbi:MAG: Mth938-like domain-containing protein [Candidatus Berkiellales bacterium]